MSFLPPDPSRSLFLRTSALCALLVLLAGCATPARRAHGAPPPRQAPLAAQAEYFGGAILAEARVTAFEIGALRPAGLGEPGRGDRPDHHGPPPGGGGMPPGGAPHPVAPPPAGSPAGRSHAPRAATLPGQTLHLTFTNRSAAPQTFVVAELNSLIGNFAPEPGRLTLAPGESAALAPVSGDAGGLLRWLDLTLTLRGERGTENRVIHLEPIGESTAPPPLPPAR